MNNVTLIGNLARDPELKYTTGQNQTAVCRFTIAVEDGYGEKKKTHWIPILTWGKQAENCEKYLHKGSKVGVSGKLQTGSYKDKEGKTVYTWEVSAMNVEFLGGREVTEVAKDEMPPASLEEMAMPENLRDDDIPF